MQKDNFSSKEVNKTTSLETLSDEQLCEIYKHDNACAQAAEETLIKRFNKMVRSCARTYFLVGGDSEDLIQEGMLGLIKAIRQYDNSKGASFATFAK